MDYEEELIQHLTNKRTDLEHFDNVIESFDDRILDLVLSRGFKVRDYFGIEGEGIKTIGKKLVEDCIVDINHCEECNSPQKPNYDFMGAYVFFVDNRPIYVGRSRGVIERINQHVSGNNHNSSSAAYSIGKIIYTLKTGEKPPKGRGKFDFSVYGKEAQSFLLKSTVKFSPFSSHQHEDLYLFEIYCSMRFGTNMNKFRTH